MGGECVCACELVCVCGASGVRVCVVPACGVLAHLHVGHHPRDHGHLATRERITVGCLAGRDEQQLGVFSVK